MTRAARDRINVLGASGSGASTTARALARALAVPCFDSDDYFHGPSDPPFRNPRAPEDRRALIERDLAHDESWVLGGGVAGWEPAPDLRFTLVVFVWLPVDVRIARLRAREAERFGARIAHGGDMHDDHEAFIAWAARYDAGDVEGKTRARHEDYLRLLACPVVRVEGAHPVDEIVRRVLAARAT